MPVAGGQLTMSRAQSANQEDHLADNVVKCVCTYCTHRIIYIIYIKAQRASKEENKNNNNQKNHLADNVVKCVCEQASGTYCTYRNRCSKHRQRGNQDHVVDVVQRNNVCKNKLLY